MSAMSHCSTSSMHSQVVGGQKQVMSRHTQSATAISSPRTSTCVSPAKLTQECQQTSAVKFLFLLENATIRAMLTHQYGTTAEMPDASLPVPRSNSLTNPTLDNHFGITCGEKNLKNPALMTLMTDTSQWRRVDLAPKSSPPLDACYGTWQGGAGAREQQSHAAATGSEGPRLAVKVPGWL